MERLRPMSDAPTTNGTEILIYDDHGYISLVHRTGAGWTCSAAGELAYSEDGKTVYGIRDPGPYEESLTPRAIGWLPVRQHPGVKEARAEVATETSPSNFVDPWTRALASVSAGLCMCSACVNGRGEMQVTMHLCPICGNKRCPKAEDHRFCCSGSNSAGQVGELEAAP